MIVLDTYAAVLWTADPGKLGKKAAAAIDQADVVGIPTIVFWEVALLVRKGKLKWGISVQEWAKSVMSLSRVHPLPLTVEIALAAEALAIHPDPADRFIVATAQHFGAALVTKDDLIRSQGAVTTIW